VVDIAKAAEQGGASWLTIHARTKQQMYQPPVDYVAVGRARAALSIPVVANGDIACAASLARCARESGARGFMIGRAALAHPTLFRALRGEALQAAREQPLARVLQAYLGLMQQAGFEPGARLRRLKQWLGLGRVFGSDAERWFERLKRVEQVTDAEALLASAGDVIEPTSPAPGAIAAAQFTAAAL
jgi:tRNA-dihydrouridine synthase C